jgi:hypothetical protein
MTHKFFLKWNKISGFYIIYINIFTVNNGKNNFLEPIAEFFVDDGIDSYEIYEWDNENHAEALKMLEQLNGPKVEEVGKKVDFGLSEYY